MRFFTFLMMLLVAFLVLAGFAEGLSWAPVHHVFVNVPGPTEYVDVPGPERIITVPGPERVVVKTKVLTLRQRCPSVADALNGYERLTLR